MQELDAALHELSSFSHVAFTSRNGIAAVLGRLTSLLGVPCRCQQSIIVWL